MNIEQCRKAIEASFPDIKVETIKANDIQGWDSFVVAVNGTHIFRFPTRPRVVKQLGFEIKVLPELAKRLPVRIPNFEHVWPGSEKQPRMFVGYQMIPGTVLSKKPPFEPKKKEELAKVLGSILTRLHTFPVKTALGAGMKPATPLTWKDDYEKMLERHQRNTFPSMEPELQEKSILLFDEFLENDDFFLFTPALNHGDLAPDEHILWNPETEEITGIIDWGDMQIGDPALDFTGILCDCGPDFTKMVLAEYNREMPPDPTMLDRAEWYMKLFGFHNIEYGHLINDDHWIREGLSDLRNL